MNCALKYTPNIKTAYAKAKPNWGYNLGYRGSMGFSLYNGLNNRITVRNFKNSGLDLSLNYTWSHAIDYLPQRPRDPGQ